MVIVILDVNVSDEFRFPADEVDTVTLNCLVSCCHRHITKEENRRLYSEWKFTPNGVTLRRSNVDPAAEQSCDSFHRRTRTCR